MPSLIIPNTIREELRERPSKWLFLEARMRRFSELGVKMEPQRNETLARPEPSSRRIIQLDLDEE